MLQGPPRGVAEFEAVRALTGEAIGERPLLPPAAPPPRLSWSREPTLMKPSPPGEDKLLAKPGEAGGTRAGEAGALDGEAETALEGRETLLAKPTDEAGDE